jgi:RNA polymerase sigma-70 factor, ECF subfamily
MIQSIASMVNLRATASKGGVTKDDTTVQSRAAGAGLDAHGLEAQRAHLTRTATWLLGNRQAAQAAVRAALLAAAGAPHAPTDPAALRPWLFGLLKQHLMDALWRQTGMAPLHDDSAETGGEPAFLADGHWCNEPAAWGDPQTTVAQPAFMSLLERCIDRLPKNTARVFTMREILGMDTQEICASVGISPATCAAMLRRARLAMHARLENDWFRASRV